MGMVGSRYSGMMEMVPAGGDAADIQDDTGKQIMSKEGIYYDMIER